MSPSAAMNKLISRISRAWLEENAHLYGYIIRYPADGESETGYAFEPWHVRYLGEQAASVRETSSRRAAGSSAGASAPGAVA